MIMETCNLTGIRSYHHTHLGLEQQAMNLTVLQRWMIKLNDLIISVLEENIPYVSARNSFPSLGKFMFLMKIIILSSILLG
jgi:hypothetical protein